MSESYSECQKITPLFSHQAEEVEVVDDRVEEVVELSQEEMAARQAAAEEIMKRNQSNQEADDQDELNDQLTELIVTEPQGAAWENQSMSQMSKLSTTSCRNRILTLIKALFNSQRSKLIFLESFKQNCEILTVFQTNSIPNKQFGHMMPEVGKETTLSFFCFLFRNVKQEVYFPEVGKESTVSKESQDF